MFITMTQRELDSALKEAREETSEDVSDCLDIRRITNGTYSLFVHLNHWEKELPIKVVGQK